MRIFSLIITFAMLAFLYSCGKDDGIVNPPDNELIINEKVISQDSSTFKTSIDAISQNSLTLKKSAAISQEITEGSIIISDYGEGVCRYVLNIQENGEKLVLTTRTARLDEVILEGRIEYKKTITPELLKNFSASDENIIFYKSSHGNTTVDFGPWKVGGNFDITFDAKTVFAPPELLFVVEFKNGVVYLEASIKIENSTTLATETTRAVIIGGTYKPQWAKFSLPPIVIPQLFLIITPKLQFYLGISAEISGAVKHEVTAITTILAGVNYANEDLSSISEFSTDFQYEVTKSSSGELKPYIVLPKLGFYLDGFLGPFIELNEGIKYKNDNIHHGLYPSVAANWGGEIDIFGLLTLKETWPIFEREWTLFEEELDDNGPADTSSVKDIDGNTYKTIKIGTQWWMAENLKATHYRNGDHIPNVTDAFQWSGLTTGAYCSYDNNEDNVDTYGHLYNWYTVNDSRNLAPEGWHVPSFAEWQILINYLGGEDIAGGKMKESDYSHWHSPNTGATNESGFSALPAGFRYSVGNAAGRFDHLGTATSFWSSTKTSSGMAWYYGLDYANTGVYPYWGTYSDGVSVRCIKD